MMLECNGGMKNTFTSMPLSAEEVLTYRSKKSRNACLSTSRKFFYAVFIFSEHQLIYFYGKKPLLSQKRQNKGQVV